MRLQRRCICLYRPMYADVTGCSATSKGRGYMGHIAVTVNSRTCQVWTSNSPHAHGMHDPNMYPDSTVEDAQNYCRNPDNSAYGLWCYTTDPAVRSERCNIPLCGESTCCSTRGSVGIGSGVFRGRAMMRPSLVFGLTVFWIIFALFL